MERSAVEHKLQLAAAEIAAESWVLGILVVGSFAGESLCDVQFDPAVSDIDLIVLHDRRTDGDRRYLCHRTHGLLLDIKYWTPEVAQAGLCGAQAAQILMHSGGVRVLLDRDGSATRIADEVRAVGSQPLEPITATMRLVLDTPRRVLHTAARDAIAAGDWPQAWFTLYWCAGRLIEVAFRMAGVPYLDLGKGLRPCRACFPALALRISRALEGCDPEASRVALVHLAEELLGDVAYEGDGFDTGWFA